MNLLIILLLITTITIKADTIADIEKRMEICLKHAEQTDDPFKKRVWTDRADLEKALILFEKKYYTKEEG